MIHNAHNPQDTISTIALWGKQSKDYVVSTWLEDPLGAPQLSAYLNDISKQFLEDPDLPASYPSKTIVEIMLANESRSGISPAEVPLNEDAMVFVAAVHGQHYAYENRMKLVVHDVLRKLQEKPKLSRLLYDKMIVRDDGVSLPLRWPDDLLRHPKSVETKANYTVPFTGPHLVVYVVGSDAGTLNPWEIKDHLGLTVEEAYSAPAAFPLFVNEALHDYVNNWATWVVEHLFHFPIEDWIDDVVNGLMFIACSCSGSGGVLFFFKPGFDVDDIKFREMLATTYYDKRKRVLRPAFEKFYFRCFRQAFKPGGNAAKRLCSEYEQGTAAATD